MSVFYMRKDGLYEFDGKTMKNLTPPPLPVPPADLRWDNRRLGVPVNNLGRYHLERLNMEQVNVEPIQPEELLREWESGGHRLTQAPTGLMYDEHEPFLQALRAYVEGKKNYAFECKVDKQTGEVRDFKPYDPPRGDSGEWVSFQMNVPQRWKRPSLWSRLKAWLKLWRN